MGFDIKKHLKKDVTKKLMENKSLASLKIKGLENRNKQLKRTRQESYQKYRDEIEKKPSYPKEWRGI